MFTQQERHEVIEFTKQLIAIPSESSRESDVANAIRHKMIELGYDDAWIDEMGNVVGRVGTGDGPSVLFDGHIDTVGVTDPTNWKHDPYGGAVESGRIYGRGSSDMKGSIAAMVYAAAKLVEKRNTMKGTVYVSGTVLEECIEGPGLEKVALAVKPDYVVIGESTSLNLAVGQRGRGEVVIETIGKPAHSSSPEVGINAVEKMAEALPYINKLEMPLDELLGRGLMVLTDIISRPYPGVSVVPDLCRATFDRRLLVGETIESVVQHVSGCLDALRKQDPEFEARVSIAQADHSTYTGYSVKAPKFAPAWKFEREHPLVRLSAQALRKAGIEFSIGAYAFCTNGSYSAGKLGIPTVGFGPGEENQAHTIDESISIDALLKALDGYLAIASAVCDIE